MPFKWTIFPDERLVEAAAIGKLPMSELHEYYSDLVQRKAMGYRKLVDVSAVTELDSTQDLAEISATVTLYSRLGLGPVGPLAIVATTASAHAKAEDLLLGASATRPSRIFSSVEEARAWLRTQP